MRAPHLSLSLVALTIAMTPLACKRKPPPPVTTAAAAATATAPPPPSPGPPDYAVDPAARTIPHREGMRRCPVSADGAYTIIRDVEGGLEIDVVGKNEPAVLEIRTRTLRLLTGGNRSIRPKPVTGAPMRPAHAKPREGPGNSGQCPIMFGDALVRAEPLAHGTRFHISAESPADVGWLRAESRALFERLRQGG